MKEIGSKTKWQDSAHIITPMDPFILGNGLTINTMEGANLHLPTVRITKVNGKIT